jgi:chromate transporter
MATGENTLMALALAFAPLSLVSIGGGPAIVAEMQHQSVAAHHWVTAREFADLFAISRVAPGPGALLVTLIGWVAAGWRGAFVVSLAFFLPTSLLIYGAAHVWNRWRGSVWHRSVEIGFAPIGAGLALAGAPVVLNTGHGGFLGWVVAVAVATCRIWRPNFHPLILLGLGAVVFAAAHSLV